MNWVDFWSAWKKWRTVPKLNLRPHEYVPYIYVHKYIHICNIHMHIFTCVSLKCKLLLNVGHRVQPAVAGFAAGSESHPRWTSLNEWNSNSWDSNWESFRTIEMIHQMFVQQSLFPIVDIVADGFDYVHGKKKTVRFFLTTLFWDDDANLTNISLKM